MGIILRLTYACVFSYLELSQRLAQPPGAGSLEIKGFDGPWRWILTRIYVPGPWTWAVAGDHTFPPQYLSPGASKSLNVQLSSPPETMLLANNRLGIGGLNNMFPMFFYSTGRVRLLTRWVQGKPWAGVERSEPDSNGRCDSSEKNDQ